MLIVRTDRGGMGFLRLHKSCFSRNVFVFMLISVGETLKWGVFFQKLSLLYSTVMCRKKTTYGRLHFAFCSPFLERSVGKCRWSVGGFFTNAYLYENNIYI